MKDKEILIGLIRKMKEVAGDITIDLPDDEESELNDKLIAIAIEIEEATIPVFGEKINMDFGVSNAVFHNTEEVIQSIRDYEPTAEE